MATSGRQDLHHDAVASTSTATRRAVGAGLPPERDCESIPAIDLGDGERQVGELRVVKLLAHPLEDLVGNVALGDQGDGLVPFECSAFAFGVAGCLPPGVQKVESLLTLA